MTLPIPQYRVSTLQTRGDDILVFIQRNWPTIPQPFLPRSTNEWTEEDDDWAEEWLQTASGAVWMHLYQGRVNAK